LIDRQLTECTFDGLEWGEEYRIYDTDGRKFDYRDYDERTTRVVSGPLGEHKFPGTSWPDRESARRHWAGRARVLQEYLIPGRWAFRIAR